MSPERLAEIRERRDDQPWLFSGMIDELIDALTAERARAEKAEAKFAEADRRLDLAIKWIADSRWDSAGAGRLLNQIDIPYQKELSK